MAPGKRVRLTADVRRAQLVAEATALIARIGYHRFSIKALSEATGLTRAGVLHHVGSKEQLLLDVLALRDERDTEGIDPTMPTREILDRIVRRNIEQPEIVRLYTVLAAEALDPAHPAHAYFADRLHTGTTLFTELLGDHETAVEIYAFMDGIQLNWLRDPTIDIWHQWTRFANRLFNTE
ncbi:helix-turn-helix domain-containing protein [Actinoplanes sp. NPDC026619]|uniref:TetR/AcrR family transcriptional regulator n=1 Tax=Actinoplanes sp. NPDC026619 TaxID=3155798 RepID=UPI00340D2FC2